MKRTMPQTNYCKHILMFAAAGTLLFGLLCCTKGAGSPPLTNPSATVKKAQIATMEDDGILSNLDCIKCHITASKGITDNGGLHKSEVSCQDCHDGHPPGVKNIIPSCNQCHDGQAHYDLKGCLTCHSNPHTPMHISLADNLTDACLSCHEEQKPQLEQFESAHSELDCTSCHQETHGMVPSCLSCHGEGHSAEMTQMDCANCHHAHKPLMISYASNLASKQCASCHDLAFTQLMANSTKHHDVSCVSCHKSEHKMIPKCEDCHGTPHSAAITAKFKNCGDCHNTAHDLNK